MLIFKTLKSLLEKEKKGKKYIQWKKPQKSEVMKGKDNESNQHVVGTFPIINKNVFFYHEVSLKQCTVWSFQICVPMMNPLRSQFYTVWIDAIYN